jgi:hypothetical protein
MRKGFTVFCCFVWLAVTSMSTWADVQVAAKQTDNSKTITATSKPATQPAVTPAVAPAELKPASTDAAAPPATAKPRPEHKVKPQLADPMP